MVYNVRRFTGRFRRFYYIQGMSYQKYYDTYLSGGKFRVDWHLRGTAIITEDEFPKDSLTIDTPEDSSAFVMGLIEKSHDIDATWDGKSI
jgi:hypothetical protein